MSGLACQVLLCSSLSQKVGTCLGGGKSVRLAARPPGGNS